MLDGVFSVQVCWQDVSRWLLKCLGVQDVLWGYKIFAKWCVGCSGWLLGVQCVCWAVAIWLLDGFMGFGVGRLKGCF